MYNCFVVIFQYLGAYSVSKTALLGLTKALVPQLATKNIRVNAVAPGMIKTKFSEQVCIFYDHFLISFKGSYLVGQLVVCKGTQSQHILSGDFSPSSTDSGRANCELLKKD